MSDISELQQRVRDAGQRCGQLAEQDRQHGARLSSLLTQVEEGLARGRQEIDELKAELTRIQAENEQLKAMLQNLLAALENGGGQGLGTAMHELEGRINRLTETASAISDSIHAKDNNGKETFWAENIDIDRVEILLNSNRDLYRPGETVRFDYDTVGGDLSAATLHYKITSNGNFVAEGDLASEKGNFALTVPEGSDIPESYTATVYVKNAEGVVKEQDSIQVKLEKGFYLVFTTDKNAYAPGETATISYSLIPVGYDTYPDEIDIYVGLMGLRLDVAEANRDASGYGSLQYKIPNNAKNGEHVLLVGTSAESALGSSMGTMGFTMKTVSIREGGANPFGVKGVTIGDIPLFSFIPLIIAIIALIFAFMAMKGKDVLKKKDTPPKEPEPELGEDIAPPPDYASPIDDGPEAASPPSTVPTAPAPPLEEPYAQPPDTQSPPPPPPPQ